MTETGRRSPADRASSVWRFVLQSLRTIRRTAKMAVADVSSVRRASHDERWAYRREGRERGEGKGEAEVDRGKAEGDFRLVSLVSAESFDRAREVAGLRSTSLPSHKTAPQRQ